MVFILVFCLYCSCSFLLLLFCLVSSSWYKLKPCDLRKVLGPSHGHLGRKGLPKCRLLWWLLSSKGLTTRADPNVPVEDLTRASLFRMYTEAKAIGPIHFALLAEGCTSGKALAHASRVVEKTLREQEPFIFKGSRMTLYGGGKTPIKATTRLRNSGRPWWFSIWLASHSAPR